MEATVAETLWAPPEPEQKPKRHRAVWALSEVEKNRVRDTFEAVCAGFEARGRKGFKMEAYELTAAHHGISNETVRKLIKNR